MPDPMTRREFAGLVATGTVLSSSTLTAVAADKPAPVAKSQPPAAVSPVEVLVSLVQEKYPDERLDQAALDEVRSDFRHFLSRSKILSSFSLVNSDEPGFVFSAWRADGPTA